MPRTKLQEKLKPMNYVQANIDYYTTYYDYDLEKIAEVMRCSVGTVYNRQRKPGSYTILELQRLADSFHVSIKDLVLPKKSAE